MLRGQCRVDDGDGGSFRREAVLLNGLRKSGQGFFGHVDYSGCAGIGQRFPIDIGGQAAFVVVAGDVLEAAGVQAMRERNAERGGGGLSGGDAGDDFDRDACFLGGEEFFAGAAENERVAAFEAQDVFAGAGVCDHEGVDVVLAAGGAIAHFADGDFFGFRAGQREDFGGDEGIVEDDVRRFEGAQGFERQQFRIAGACAC